MAPLWHCFPIVKHAARHHRHHWHRIAHHARRAATLAVSKPALLAGVVCVATSWPAPQPVEHLEIARAASSGAEHLEMPGEFDLAFAPVPDFPFPSPPPELPPPELPGLPPTLGPPETPPPETPKTPVAPVPEPSSALLLALPTALAIALGRKLT